MKTVDNFEEIYNTLCKMNMHNVIKCNNEYYVITILKRFKDIDKEIDTSNIKEDDLVFKTIIITELKDVLRYRELITYMCDNLKCRAYITSSPRTINGLQYGLLTNIGKFLVDSSEYNPINYNNLIDKTGKGNYIANHVSICDNFDKTHIYVIDIDKKLSSSELDMIKNKLGDRYILTYETPNGYHILSYCYDPKEFNKFIEKTFNVTKDTNFIEQKGKGCRMLLYANI